MSRLGRFLDFHSRYERNSETVANMASDIINGEMFCSQWTFIFDGRLSRCAATFGKHLNY